MRVLYVGLAALLAVSGCKGGEQGAGTAVEAATPVPFYTAAASLLAAWVDAEIAALGATPSRVPGPDAVAADDGEPFSCPMAEDAPAEEGRTRWRGRDPGGNSSSTRCADSR